MGEFDRVYLFFARQSDVPIHKFKKVKIAEFEDSFLKQKENMDAKSDSISEYDKKLFAQLDPLGKLMLEMGKNKYSKFNILVEIGDRANRVNLLKFPVLIKNSFFISCWTLSDEYLE